MKATTFAMALMAISRTLNAEELQPTREMSNYYDTGIVHENLMALKIAQFQDHRLKGWFDSWKYRIFDRLRPFVPCRNGKAEVHKGDPMNTFKCKNIDFYDFMSHAELGSRIGEGSSSWGWTAPNGREFVAIGQYDGTAFAEVSKRGKLIYLGRLPQYDSIGSYWREIRSYKNYMLIGSEAVGHGVQIFDMRKLLSVNPRSPRIFSNQKDLTAHWDETPLGRTHNVHANEELGYGFAVGAQPRNSSCASGLIYIDLSNPAEPKSPGCAAGDGYVHDLECLRYRGPDSKYNGRDICFGYNEDTLTIYDSTEKTRTKIISRTTYRGANYTHQGSVLNRNWIDFMLMDDETDELFGNVAPASEGYPITYIWDLRSLEKPKQTGFFQNRYAKTIDHNQYVIDGLSFQSNYGAGLHVLDVSSIPKDPTGKGVSVAGFIDIFPEDDQEEGGGLVQFAGTWSNYPYFKSGYILINTIERGAFIVKLAQRRWWQRLL